jgi:putative flippase GtrA
MINSRTVSQFGRYILTGGGAALIDLAIFAYLSAGIMPIPAAATCSFIVAAVSNYILTSLFVYKTKLDVRRLSLFVAVATIGLLINVSVTVIVVRSISIIPVAAKVIGIGAAFLINFTANTMFVFRTRI